MKDLWPSLREHWEGLDDSAKAAWAAAIVALFVLLFGQRGLLPALWSGVVRIARAIGHRLRPRAPETDRRNGLPSRRPFSGRDALASSLATTLAQRGRLIIEGPRGCGKTSLALEIAHLIGGRRDSRSSFAWIDLKNRESSAAELVDAVAIVMGLQSVANAEPAAKLDMLGHLVPGAGNWLLVVDNFESVPVGEREKAFRLLDDFPGNVQLLVTCAVELPFAHGMELRHINEMLLPEMLQVIQGEISRDQRLYALGLTQDQKEQLFTHTRGNALAMKWALGNLSRGAPLAQLLESLSLGEAEILAVLFGDIWDHLSAEARRLAVTIAEISVDPSRELLQLVWGQRAPLQPLINELTDAKLLEVGGSGDHGKLLLSLHPLAREYIRRAGSRINRVPLSERSAAVVAFVARYGENGSEEDMHFVGVQMGFVLQVLDEAVSAGVWTDATAIGVAVEESFLTLGLLRARRDYGLLLSEHARDTPSQPWAMRLLVTGAQAASLMGDFDAADNALLTAETRAVSTSQDQVVRARRARAANLFRGGRVPECGELLIGMLEEAARLQDDFLFVDVCYLQANYAYECGNYEESLKACDDIDRAVERTQSYRRARAYSGEQRALVFMEQLRVREARRAIGAADGVARSFADARQIARIELAQAKLWYLSLRFRRARRVAHRLDSEFRSLGLLNEAEEASALSKAIGVRDWMRRIAGRGSRRTKFFNLPIGGD